MLLGSILVQVSNVTVSGKGRRYRGDWQRRESTTHDVDEMFEKVFHNALQDIAIYGEYFSSRHTVLTGDCRTMISKSRKSDLIIFSPPYPNSFDYTDIYNLELWVLGYLRAPKNNSTLRTATLRSHVQIKRDFRLHNSMTSQTLFRTIHKLERHRDQLWDHHIPKMVGAYFDDLVTVLKECRRKLAAHGQLIMVVGDSRYAGVSVDSESIFGELAQENGYDVLERRAIRSMRTSAQQGGKHQLNEALIRLRVQR